MMLNKIKEKLQSKSERRKEKVDFRSVLLMLSFLIIGIISYLISRNVIFFLCSMVLGILWTVGFSDGFQESRRKEEVMTDYKDNITFLTLFCHYSYMLNSYQEGFREAYERMKLSHCRDRITDYLENPTDGLPLKVTGSRTEHAFLSLIHRYYQSKEETGRDEMSRLFSLLERYREEFMEK